MSEKYKSAIKQARKAVKDGRTEDATVWLAIANSLLDACKSGVR